MIEPTEVVRRKNEAFNAQNAEQTMQYFSPSIEMATPIGVFRGRDQVSQFFSAFWKAFPDLWLTVVDETAEGDHVVLQLRSKGTHQGTLSTPAGDIAASGRSLDLAMSDHFEVRDGQIVAVQLYFDRLSLLEQLGAVPVPAAT